MTTEQVYTMAGAESELLDHIKSRKLRYFGHVMRLPHDNIESSVLTGLVEGGIRGRGRPRVGWLDNIVAWTGLSGATLLHATRDIRSYNSLFSKLSEFMLSVPRVHGHKRLDDDVTG